MGNLSTFHGLDPRWLKSNRVYRIYVTPDRLCGGYIAGQLYDEQSAAIQLQGLSVFLRGYVNRALQRRKDREALYDTLDPTSAAFLAADQNNFQIERQHVIQITVNHKRSLWTSHNVGTIDLAFGDGSHRRFVLISDQDADAIAETLKHFFPKIATVGAASPPPQSKPRTQGWIQLALLSVFFFAFAIVFMITAFLPVGNLGFLVIGAVNLWAAINCLRRADKKRKSSAEDNEPADR